MADDNFKAGLQINQHDLDNEFIAQPTRNQDVWDAYAEAISLHDLCKDELKRTDAEISEGLREDTTQKYSETRLAQLVLLDRRHIDGVRQLADAHKTMTELQGMTESYQQRMTALRELAALYQSKYFSRDSAPGSQMSRTAIIRDKMTSNRNPLPLSKELPSETKGDPFLDEITRRGSSKS